VLKRLADGEDIDLDAAIEARADRRAGTTPSEQVYMRRDRREREVAAAFLLDMSASTDSEVQDSSERLKRPTGTWGSGAAGAARDYDYVGIYDDDPLWGPSRSGKPPRRRRVIDVEKEALLLMAEALDALGDAYGVFGFSGYGREQVEFYVAKDFGESCDQRARERIAAIRPKRSTRMGPAIRHATRKLRAQEARVRVLLVLSDGYPQDYDYGRDRTSRAYGIQDTMMALREAELQGIHTFCLTVDPAGHDYLREMCPERQYLVIDDVASLPRELPKVYRGLTT
jgi:nitric oxide reductase activation protein